VVAPFVFDGLQARLAERAGFSVLYLTGFGAAASRGLPDLGLLGMSDMAAAVAVVAGASSLPVVADADTGYGGVLNVMRTVEAYEASGAAGLHIEDQVWPKRCGFFAGKEVIRLDDMVAKVRAACDARGDTDTVIIARTDALAPHGWG
jgi:2-methylisocitrate lyase-like PEP mutase family enzyme